MENVIKDVSAAVSSAVSSAAIVSALGRLIPGKKEDENQEDMTSFIRTILIIIGVIVVICGVVFAIVRFVQPKLRGYSDLEGDEEEEDCQEDPDIADEFEEEQN